MRRLVAHWQGDETKIEQKLILSSTNRQANSLNLLCQEVRRERGELGENSITIGDGAEVHAGDRVLFTRNNKWLSVHNGDLATVVKVTPNGTKGDAITVKLDKGGGAGGDGKLLTVTLSAYDRSNIRLGYSVTTHKAQGATVENAYVFLYGQMTDRQMAYVQASRAKGETRIYTTKDEAGPELCDLARAMSRDRKKTMAHDAVEDEAPSSKPQQGRRGIKIKLSNKF